MNLGNLDIEWISTLVDEIALEKPIDFEKYNFESTKKLAILGAVEHVQSIISNPELSDDDRGAAIIAIISYLIMENMILHLEILQK